IVQKLYNFLSSSTYRWKLFTDTLRAKNERHIIVAKTLPDTRWSARYDTVKALKVNYKEVIETLGILCKIITCYIWGDILERMNKVNELLQSESLTLKTVIEHMDSLCEFVKVIRKDFDTYKKDALRLAELLRHKSDGEISYRRTSDRKIKRKPQFDEKGKFKTQTFIAVCECLITEISKHTEAYRRAMNDFEFIFDYEEDNVSKKRAAAAKLVQKYSKDLEKELENEIIHFHERVKQSQTANDASNVTEAMKTVLSSGCFPNMAIALCIYLSMPCIVCEGERSFSKLTRIKNEKRTTVGQEKLNALSIIAIEWDIARKMDSSNLIREFTRLSIALGKLQIWCPS
uniref:HAT C-terminal dimerisation domain-containing protein n=1 Tax=Latimeria chalumnae TaxID=7897 RepID=H2ZUC9_LATCH